MKKIIIFALILATFLTQVQALTVEQNITASSILGQISNNLVLSDGSHVAVGTTNSLLDEGNPNKLAYMDKRTDGNLESTALVVKYNKDGSIAVINTFGGEADDRFLYAYPTTDGGFIAQGDTDSQSGEDMAKYKLTPSGNNRDAIVVKYDKNCNIEWAVRHKRVQATFWYA